MSKLTFDQKVIEFNEEKNLQKYNTNRVGCDFSDCRRMPSWFKYNLSEIEERAKNLDEGCINILLRYYASYKRDEESAKVYRDLLDKSKEITHDSIKINNEGNSRHLKNISRNKMLFHLKLTEFININDDRKYDSKVHDNLKFSDGTGVNNWFNNNKYRVLDNKIVLNDYIRVKGPQKKRLDFYQKVKEFEKESNMKKYVTSNKELKFSDDVIMSMWFYNNRAKILKYSFKIKAEYYLYKDGNIKSYDLISIYRYYDKDTARIVLER